MAGEIFEVSTSSIELLTINSKLVTIPDAIVDFSAATYVTGTFQGNGAGLTKLTASYLSSTVTASYANTASYATTASFALNGGSSLTTGSSYPITSSRAITASFALTNISPYAGLISTPTISDNTSSFVVTFGTSSVNLFNNSSGIGSISQYSLPQTTFTIPASLSASFIYATTNGITASYKSTNVLSDIDGKLKVLVATVYRADEDAHWMETQAEGLALANKINNRLVETERFKWNSGFTLYETGSNQFVITAGDVWYGATKLSQNEFNSTNTGSVNPMFETHYAYHSASEWVIPVVSDGKYNNRYYDDGTNLVALGPNSWSVNYFYRILGENPFDEDVFYLTSNYQYLDLASAQIDTVPSSIPTVLDDVSILVGRIIFQSGSTSGTVESAFTSDFGQSTITQHNALAGIQGGAGGQYYHLNLADYTGTGTGLVVRQSEPTLTNPTFAAATPYNIPYWDTSGHLTLTGSVQVYNDAYVMINSASFPDPANPETLLVKQIDINSTNIIGAYSDIDNFSQIYNQNLNTGSFSSTDIVATADIGTQDANYINVGIAGSNFSSSDWPWNKALDGYLLMDGGDLWIGTQTDNKIKFFINNTASIGYLYSDGINASGSLIGTSSWSSRATSASFAISASWAPSSTLSNSASWASSSISSSYALTASYISGSVNGFIASSSYAFTSSLTFVANAISFVPNAAVSASWVSASARITTADTASYYNQLWLSTGSTYPITTSWATNAITATTANAISFVPNASVNATQSIYATSASWISSSVRITTADTASYVLASGISGTVSNATNAIYATQSLNATNSIQATSASFASSSISASYATTALNLLGSVTSATNATFATSASWASSSLSASYAPSGTPTFTGKVDYQVPVWISNTLTATSPIYASASKVFIGPVSQSTSGEVLYVSGDSTISNNFIAEFAHDANTYTQIKIENKNAGNSASADLIVEGDKATESLGYVDLGINSSGYSEPAFSLVGALDAYLYTVGSASLGGDLAIGTLSANRAIMFHTSGSKTTDERLRITDLNITSSVPFKSPAFLGTSSYASASLSSLTASYVTGSKVSRGGTMYNSSGITSGANIIIWEAPVACTVTNVKGYRVGGTTATINARKNGTLNHLASDLTISSTDTWTDGGAVQNASYVAGDKLEIMIVTVGGSPTQIAVQVNLIK